MKSKDFANLRKAIYEDYENSTPKTAEIVAIQKDYCISKYGSKKTQATISAALRVLSNGTN